MEDTRSAQLFREVLTKTAANRIKWEATASEDEYSSIVSGSFTLAILTTHDRDSWGNPEENIALVLRGKEGELLRVSSDVEGVSWPELVRLRELARRQALGVDAKVDQVLGVLGKL